MFRHLLESVRFPANEEGEFPAGWCGRDRSIVDRQSMSLKEQGVPRHADDSFDEDFFALPGETHQNDIAAGRVGKKTCFQGCPWYVYPINHLVCQDNISILKRRHHGRGDNPDRDNEKAAQDDKNKYKKKSAARCLMKDLVES